jgi:hypothetical protein
VDWIYQYLIPKTQTMPSTSLAIMVRDDAERLRRAIQSCKDAVDEVVILDTGSKDSTVEVARAEGATVHEIEWPNNFAKALNVLLSHVKTDWTLRLDSDEWFEESPDAILGDCIGQEDAFGFRLIRRDIQPQGGFEEIALLRLWRTSPKLQYRGLVHENIPIDSFQQVWPHKVEKSAPLWFWHDGYGQGHIDKIRRNLPLMEQELQQNPDQPYFEAMLAKGYKDVGDPQWRARMIEIVDRSLGDLEAVTPILSVIYSDVLNSIQGPDLKTAKTDQIVLKALHWFGTSPPILVALSNLELRRGKKDKALELLLALEEMATTGEYDRGMPVNPGLFGKQFWQHLDRLADQMGRWDICKRCEPHL